MNGEHSRQSIGRSALSIDPLVPNSTLEFDTQGTTLQGSQNYVAHYHIPPINVTEQIETLSRRKPEVSNEEVLEALGNFDTAMNQAQDAVSSGPNNSGLPLTTPTAVISAMMAEFNKMKDKLDLQEEQSALDKAKLAAEVNRLRAEVAAGQETISIIDQRKLMTHKGSRPGHEDHTINNQGTTSNPTDSLDMKSAGNGQNLSPIQFEINGSTTPPLRNKPEELFNDKSLPPPSHNVKETQDLIKTPQRHSSSPFNDNGINLGSPTNQTQPPSRVDKVVRIENQGLTPPQSMGEPSMKDLFETLTKNINNKHGDIQTQIQNSQVVTQDMIKHNINTVVATTQQSIKDVVTKTQDQINSNNKVIQQSINSVIATTQQSINNVVSETQVQIDGNNKVNLNKILMSS